LACVFLTTTKKHEAHFYLPLLLASETVSNSVIYTKASVGSFVQQIVFVVVVA
jgi:hypothetical protein